MHLHAISTTVSRELFGARQEISGSQRVVPPAGEADESLHASAPLRYPAGDGDLEAIVERLGGGGDLGRLFWTQDSLAAEHPRLERSAKVKRQEVEGFDIVMCHALTFRHHR